MAEPLKYITDIFDVSEGLKTEELIIGKNIESLEYLFTVSALTFSEENSASIVHPVISIPSVNTDAIFNFLKNRFEIYAAQDPKIKYCVINGNDLVGRTLVQFDNSESLEVPSLVKWRIENEEKSRHTSLFIINNVDAITQSTTITPKEILSELSSVSFEASYILFLKPSTFNFIKAIYNDDEFQSIFSRLIFFDGFDVSDVPQFKQIIENRVKNNLHAQEIPLYNLDLSEVLTISRGIPYYAFKIMEEDLKNIVIKTNGSASNVQVISTMKDTIKSMWKKIDVLTEGQIDILTVFATFPQERANIYEVQDKLKHFRKSVGKRTAILQQIRKLYENELLDRERPRGSREVYYKIKSTALPAIEFKIEEILIGGK